jgi:hypothetical protein
MAQERRRPDSVLLPTGKILIMGGENDDGALEEHDPSLTCELLDPDPATPTLTEMDTLGEE